MSNDVHSPDAGTPDREARTAAVMIVGFGPVGKLLAILLGRAGHRVIVADRKVEGYPLPRAVTHDSEFARIMQLIGLGPDRIPEVTQPYDSMYIWRNADLETLVEVDWSGLGPSGWYNTYFFNQPALEDRMDRIIRDMPAVEVFRGWSATVRSADDTTVSADLLEVATGRTVAVSSEYLIGADGANSTVRRFAGIDWHDLGFFYDWLVVDVKPDPALQFPHVAIQTCDIARPATMVPGGPGRRRWEFMRLPHETIESLNDTDRAWELLAPFGIEPGNAELERHSVYTFQAGWATAWRKGRILLAGDAAHLMPPFAGQGLGAGVRDATNLTWKLDAVLRGLAPDSVLDTYAVERLPHIQEFIDFSIQLGRVICITDAAEAAERDARMIAERAEGSGPPAPPAPRLGPGIHTEDGGTLSPQGRIHHAGQVLRFDDVHLGLVLLARDATMFATLSAEARATVARWPITLVGLEGSGAGVVTVREQGSTYRDWLDTAGHDAVLIRPDFTVYGWADADGLDGLVLDFAERVERGPATVRAFG